MPGTGRRRRLRGRPAPTRSSSATAASWRPRTSSCATRCRRARSSTSFVIAGATAACSTAGGVVICTDRPSAPSRRPARSRSCSSRRPTTGPITNTVTVDPRNAIFESDETNNVATSRRSTTGRPTGIDLTTRLAKKTDAPPGFDPIATSGTQTYTITVDNIGTQDATESACATPCRPGRCSSTPTADNGFTCTRRHADGGVVECIGGDILGTAGESTTPAATGRTARRSSIKAFAQPVVGTMHNEVRVDPLNEIAEVNEINNFEIEDTTVTNGDGDHRRVQRAEHHQDGYADEVGDQQRRDLHRRRRRTAAPIRPSTWWCATSCRPASCSSLRASRHATPAAEPVHLLARGGVVDVHRRDPRRHAQQARRRPTSRDASRIIRTLASPIPGAARTPRASIPTRDPEGQRDEQLASASVIRERRPRPSSSTSRSPRTTASAWASTPRRTALVSYDADRHERRDEPGASSVVAPRRAAGGYDVRVGDRHDDGRRTTAPSCCTHRGGRGDLHRRRRSTGPTNLAGAERARRSDIVTVVVRAPIENATITNQAVGRSESNHGRGQRDEQHRDRTDARSSRTSTSSSTRPARARRPRTPTSDYVLTVRNLGTPGRDERRGPRSAAGRPDPARRDGRGG